MYKNLLAVFFRSFPKCLLTFLFTSSLTFLFAQVKFYATINDRSIGKNDFLQVQFTMEDAANVETIIPPSFKNFSVVSGPKQQYRMSNGKIKQSVSIGFILRPLTTGSFTIGSATAIADGKKYRSNSLTVQVNSSASSKGAASNSTLSPFGNLRLRLPSEPVTHQFDDYILKKGENVAEKIKKNLFIKIDVSKKNCYLGEPVVTTYKLYTRLKSESNVVKAPSFNGFSVSELEMPDNYSLRTEKYNGREYNVYTLRKAQLYPLQSGKLNLEPVEVNNRITFLKAEYAGNRNADFFYNLLRDFANENAPGNATEQQIVTVTSDTLSINVKQLPNANKPAYFKGAVGAFKIVAVLEKNKISTDDAGALKVTISGAGNIPMINAPIVLWPQGVEGFESKASESLDKFSVPLKGDKMFIYPFTVSNPGKYIIPAINFSYFDISSQSYKSISTQPLTINAVKGSGNSQNIYNTVKKNDQRNKAWYKFIDTNLIYFIGTMALFIFLMVLFIKGKKEKKAAEIESTTHVRRSQNKITEENEFIIPANPLANAEEKLSEDDTRQFYKALDISIYKYLSQKLKVPSEELTKKKINERMDKCNVGVGTTLLVNSLLEDIQLNLYAPVFSETQMQEVYEKASEVVSLLDKQVCQ